MIAFGIIRTSQQTLRRRVVMKVLGHHKLERRHNNFTSRYDH